MPRRTKHKEQEVDAAIAEYVKQNDGADDLRDVQDYVNSKLGLTPSTATIATTLRALGLDYQASRWVWKHNPSRY